MLKYAVKFLAIHRVIWLLFGSLLAGCVGPTVANAPESMSPRGSVSTRAQVKPSLVPSSAPRKPPSTELSLATLPILPLKPDQSWVQIGRYRVISAVPTEAQRHLLHILINVTLPEEVSSIQAAIHYLLAKSGYQFSTRAASTEVLQLLQKSLPAVHRHLGPMTLEDALQTLAGAPYQLTVDPVHRVVQIVLPAPIVTLNRRW